MSIVLGVQEFQFLQSRSLHARHGFHFVGNPTAHINFLRYVDDVAGFSRSYCGSCVQVFLQLSYSCKLSICSGVSPGPHVWVDVELVPRGQNVLICSKNPNREWLQGTGQRQKTSIMPWVGAFPASFTSTRAVLIGHLARAEALRLSDPLTLHRLCEDVLELHLLGYPPRALRALMHSLPVTPTVQVFRRIGRVWLRTLRWFPKHERS